MDRTRWDLPSECTSTWRTGQSHRLRTRHPQQSRPCRLPTQKSRLVAPAVRFNSGEAVLAAFGLSGHDPVAAMGIIGNVAPATTTVCHAEPSNRR